MISYKTLKGNSSVILRKMKVNNYVKVNILAGIVNHIDG